ncbi:hypothetical protein [Cutibacterium sp. V947]|uniref:hypothetical protein n=1 Tax=Cutibacterium sp. V947 TaxID=3446480 RepID=UPI003EE14277
MSRRPVTIASLLASTCAAGSMMASPTNAEGAGFHDGWCQKDEGYAVVLYWPAKPAEVVPEIPGNLNSKTLVRCIIGAHKVSGHDGRADALTLAGFSHDGGSGQIVTSINGIEADPFAESPATWWYHTGTWEEGSGGRWDETPRWDPSLEINGFSVVVFSTDNTHLPPITPKFAKGGDDGDKPGPGPGPSTGPTGRPSHRPTGKPTHEPTGGHAKPTNKPAHEPGHGGNKPSHKPGHGHGGNHHNRLNPTAPTHGTGPKPGKNHDNADSRPNTIVTVRPTTTSPTPLSRPSSPPATPSSPTPSSSASPPAASAGPALAPQSSSSPVWGREDRTRHSPDNDEHGGAPWWVPVGVGVVALAGLAFAAIGRRHRRRPDREDEE